MTKAKCSLWFCDREHASGGFCTKHYQNWRRHGSPVPRTKEDLRTVLSAFERMHKVLEDLVYWIEPRELPGEGVGAYNRAKMYLDMYKKERV